MSATEQVVPALARSMEIETKSCDHGSGVELEAEAGVKVTLSAETRICGWQAWSGFLLSIGRNIEGASAFRSVWTDRSVSVGDGEDDTAYFELSGEALVRLHALLGDVISRARAGGAALPALHGIQPERSRSAARPTPSLPTVAREG